MRDNKKHPLLEGSLGDSGAFCERWKRSKCLSTTSEPSSYNVRCTTAEVKPEMESAEVDKNKILPEPRMSRLQCSMACTSPSHPCS